MGACTSTLQPDDSGRPECKDGQDAHTVSSGSKVYNVEAQAGSKAAEAEVRQHRDPSSPPIQARLQSAGKQQHQPQPSASGSRRPSNSGSSSTSSTTCPNVGTRARRLSFTGPCGTAATGTAAGAPAPSALHMAPAIAPDTTTSNTSSTSNTTSRSSSFQSAASSAAGKPHGHPSGATGSTPAAAEGEGSGHLTSPTTEPAPAATVAAVAAALSGQPLLPEAHPLPDRRVHFDESPATTDGKGAEEMDAQRQQQGAAAAAAESGQPAAPATRPPAASLASSNPSLTPPLSPAKAAAAAFAASEARLRRGLTGSGGSPNKAAAAALLGVPSVSPRKAASLLAVPMWDVIHSAASLSRAGREPKNRKQNQDNCFVLSQYCRPNQALMAALDGHGPNGHLVSDFLRLKLPMLLAEQLGEACRSASSTSSSTTAGSGTTRGGSSLPAPAAANAAHRATASTGSTSSTAVAALSATFQLVDEELRLGSGLNVAYSGSTAVVCLLQGRRLTTAWVGDSRAVLARQDPRGCHAICLTRDHKPSSPEERSRIITSGGRVQRLVDGRGNPVGPQRVWLSNSWVPGLAMSRALGDSVAHTVGVTSEPETCVVDICPQDKWLLLATDGVWEFVDPQMAVDVVAECKDAEEACRALVESAWAQWLVEEEKVVDDITVVAVKLNP